jgi:hypothetical protein
MVSFTIAYFFESSLFNGLWSIQIKNFSWWQGVSKTDPIWTLRRKGSATIRAAIGKPIPHAPDFHNKLLRTFPHPTWSNARPQSIARFGGAVSRHCEL